MKFNPSSVVDIVKSQLQNVLGSLTKNMAIQVLALVPIAIWSPYPWIAYSLTVLFIVSHLFSKFWYSYFAIKNPKLLGSEEHTREMTAMALGIADQGNTRVVKERTMEDLNEYLGTGSQPQLGPPQQAVSATETTTANKADS